MEVTARINVIGPRRIVTVEHIVGSGAGAGLHQLVAGAAHVPDVEVGSIVLAVTLPLHVDVQYIRPVLVYAEVEVVRGYLAVSTTIGAVPGVVGGIDLGVGGEVGLSGYIACGWRLCTSINRLIGPFVRARAGGIVILIDTGWCCRGRGCGCGGGGWGWRGLRHSRHYNDEGAHAEHKNEEQGNYRYLLHSHASMTAETRDTNALRHSRLKALLFLLWLPSYRPLPLARSATPTPFGSSAVSPIYPYLSVMGNFIINYI